MKEAETLLAHGAAPGGFSSVINHALRYTRVCTIAIHGMAHRTLLIYPLPLVAQIALACAVH
jgi:hypothetical protein